MLLIQLVVILIVLGVLLWAVNAYIPMEPRMKQIVNAVVIIGVVIWLLLMLLAAVGLVNFPGMGAPLKVGWLPGVARRVG